MASTLIFSKTRISECLFDFLTNDIMLIFQTGKRTRFINIKKERGTKMESLQERLERIERERVETLALIHAEEIRNKAAKNEELVDRLILSLNHQPTLCGLNLTTIAHVKTVFGNIACNDKCCCYNTCQQIINLTGKASAVKRAKSSGEKHKLAEVPMKTQWGENRVVRFTQLEKSMVFTPIAGENWKAFTDRCKASLKSAGFILSAGQVQGVGHKGKNAKFERLFFG